MISSKNQVKKLKFRFELDSINFNISCSKSKLANPTKRNPSPDTSQIKIKMPHEQKEQKLEQNHEEVQKTQKSLNQQRENNFPLHQDKNSEEEFQLPSIGRPQLYFYHTDELPSPRLREHEYSLKRQVHFDNELNSDSQYLLQDDDQFKIMETPKEKPKYKLKSDGNSRTKLKNNQVSVNRFEIFEDGDDIKEEEDGDVKQEVNQAQNENINANLIKKKEYDENQKKIRQKWREQQLLKKKRLDRSKKTLKKIDYNVLKQMDIDERIVLISADDQNHKAASLQEEKQLRPKRNRRIASYIQRILKLNRFFRGLTVRELIICVLKNYQSELDLIPAEKTRNSRFQCLRRRIYECVSVLYALGIVVKKTVENVQRLQLDDKVYETKDFFTADRRRRVQQQFEDAKNRLRQKKKQYFELLNRQAIFKSLVARNKKQENQDEMKIHLPIMMYEARADTMSINLRKSDPSLNFCDQLELKGRDFVQYVTNQTLMPLRKKLNINKQIPLLRIEYAEEFLKHQKQEELQLEGIKQPTVEVKKTRGRKPGSKNNKDRKKPGRPKKVDKKPKKSRIQMEGVFYDLEEDSDSDEEYHKGNRRISKK